MTRGDVWRFVEPWWAETGSPLPLGCQCASGDGGKRAWVRSADGDTWVHIHCGQPSLAVIRGQDMLNLFRFGPHHHELVETRDLTSKVEFNWVADYRWTPEVIVGSESGREARVWVHKDQPAG